MKLAHYSIRSSNLDESRRFYTEILGFRVGSRPDFDFPGLWIYLDKDESEFGVVHVIGIDEGSTDAIAGYLGEKDAATNGTGALDHIAFLATGFAEMKGRLEATKQPFRERVVPSIGLRQIFVEDPSGVVIELNYPAEESAG